MTMCERKCPNCGSWEHIEAYGIAGTSIDCAECGLLLAHKHDDANVPLAVLDSEVDAYVSVRSGVRPGAEALNPEHDKYYSGTMFLASADRSPAVTSEPAKTGERG